MWRRAGMRGEAKHHMRPRNVIIDDEDKSIVLLLHMHMPLAAFSVSPILYTKRTA
jgi:hypothetical protein